MPEITDTEAVKFVREEIRPMAERLSVLSPEIGSMMSKWFGGLNTTIGNSAENVVMEGREAEGVANLTGDDITAIMALLDTLRNAMTANGVPDRIEKPCVRAFRSRASG